MKNKPLFYKIYFSVVAVFLVLLIIGLFVLNSVLTVYEAAQPTGFVNGIIKEYLEKGDIYKLNKDFGVNLSIYENEKSFNSAFNKLSDGEKLNAVSSAKKLEGFDEVYNIKAGDSVLMTLYLEKADKAGKYGIKGYELGKAEFNSDICKTYIINAPSDIKLVVNGVEVKNEDRKDLEMPKILTNKIGDKKVVTHQTFKLSGFLTDEFELKAYDASGKEAKVTNDNNIYTVSQIILEDELNELKSLAINATQSYAKFMQEDAGLGTVAQYFDTSTEFYNYIKKTERFVWDHTGYGFEDVSFTEVHKYTDTLYSCRVKFTHYLTLGQRRYEDYFDKYVYVEKGANGLKVIDMQTPTK